MSTTTTPDHAAVFRDRADRFTAVLDGDLTLPSPCAGWTAADVVHHVITTERDFLVRHGLVEGAAPGEDPRAAWRAHRAQVQVLLEGGAGDRAIDGYFGPTTIGETLATFYGFDLVVHAWDVGRATGTEVRFTEAEMDAVEASIAQFGDHMYAEGICGPPRQVAEGADRQDRVLARTGR